VHRAYHLLVPIVMKSGSLNLLEPSWPVQACNRFTVRSLIITVCIRRIGDHHIIQFTAMFMVEMMSQHWAFLWILLIQLHTGCFKPPIWQVVFCILAFDIVPKAVVWFCNIREQTGHVMSVKWKMSLPGKSVVRTCMEICALWAVGPNSMVYDVQCDGTAPQTDCFSNFKHVQIFLAHVVKPPIWYCRARLSFGLCQNKVYKTHPANVSDIRQQIQEFIHGIQKNVMLCYSFLSTVAASVYVTIWWSSTNCHIHPLKFTMNSRRPRV